MLQDDFCRCSSEIQLQSASAAPIIGLVKNRRPRVPWGLIPTRIDSGGCDGLFEISPCVLAISAGESSC